MPSLEARVKDELLTLLDLGAAGLERVTQAYVANRSRERDLTWLALQIGKEYGAVMTHLRRSFDGSQPKPVVDLLKAIEDAREEANHYAGYLDILNWALDGEASPVTDMYHYCAPGSYRLLGFGDYKATQDRWPANYTWFTSRQHDIDQCSPWGKAVVSACAEGGAVGWHHAMSRIPVTDEFSRRVASHEQTIVDDELHHGPERVFHLAREVPSKEEWEEVKLLVQRNRSLELWQRNEQFLHPLSNDELQTLDATMHGGELAPLKVFRSALAPTA